MGSGDEGGAGRGDGGRRSEVVGGAGGWLRVPVCGAKDESVESTVVVKNMSQVICRCAYMCVCVSVCV